MINESIAKLVTYALESELIEQADVTYATNRVLELLGLDEYERPQQEFKNIDLESTLAELIDFAVENGTEADILLLLYSDGGVLTK